MQKATQTESKQNWFTKQYQSNEKKVRRFLGDVLLAGCTVGFLSQYVAKVADNYAIGVAVAAVALVLFFKNK